MLGDAVKDTFPTLVLFIHRIRKCRKKSAVHYRGGNLLDDLSAILSLDINMRIVRKCQDVTRANLIHILVHGPHLRYSEILTVQ